MKEFGPIQIRRGPWAELAVSARVEVVADGFVVVVTGEPYTGRLAPRERRFHFAGEVSDPACDALERLYNDAVEMSRGPLCCPVSAY